MTAEMKATDLHLDSGDEPWFRRNSIIQKLGLPKVEEAKIEAELKELLGEKKWALFKTSHSLDSALSVDSGDGSEMYRFRLNIFRSQRGISLAARLLQDNFHSLKNLFLPDELFEFSYISDGLVLVSGPTGSGKSTTLAALLDIISRNRPSHIITIEDPIEYIIPCGRSLVRQRETGTHVRDFPSALRDALREDPDVILVGEMRDFETVKTALAAAETGHLVFSTLHSGTAAGAVERISGMFDTGEREIVNFQLSQVLRGIVAQKLIPSYDGASMRPAVEILKNNTAVMNVIRSGKSNQLPAIIENSRKVGMRTYEESLAELALDNFITLEKAMSLSGKPESLKKIFEKIKEDKKQDGFERS
jgi:twitching motility protein PilT